MPPQAPAAPGVAPSASPHDPAEPTYGRVAKPGSAPRSKTRAKSPKGSKADAARSGVVRVAPDAHVSFPAFTVHGKCKRATREFVARHGLLWARFQHRRGARGAIMVDIDDTLINGHEHVANGFEEMRSFYVAASQLFPVHIVTARPDRDHAAVMKLLGSLGFCIPPDRLHMLPTKEYYAEDNYDYVERFKWKCYLAIGKAHGGVVLRFGDKLWDVAHYKSLSTYLKHVPDTATYLFFDPQLGGTVSDKLPGAR